MADRLPLASGSRWDGLDVVEKDGTRIQALTRTPEPLILLRLDYDVCVYPQDLRAALEANGLLPEVDELARLRAKSHEMVRTVYGFDHGLVSASAVAEVAQELESLLPKEDTKDG